MKVNELVLYRFALGAAGKLASIALEELSKPGKVDGGSSGRTADTISAPQAARYTPFPPA